MILEIRWTTPFFAIIASGPTTKPFCTQIIGEKGFGKLIDLTVIFKFASVVIVMEEYDVPRSKGCVVDGDCNVAKACVELIEPLRKWLMTIKSRKVVVEFPRKVAGRMLAIAVWFPNRSIAAFVGANNVIGKFGGFVPFKRPMKSRWLLARGPLSTATSWESSGYPWIA